MLNTTRRTFLAGAAATVALPSLVGRAQAADPLKVGFVYLTSAGDHGWTYAHDKGRKAAEAKLGDKIKSTVVENVEEGPAAERVIKELANAGNSLIFTTSFGYMNPTIKVAKSFPKVHFEHATGYQRADNVATYNLRFYEGRAICGTIAAMTSKTGKAGYIASFPIPEVVMGINAFTSAARKVNPKFETKVIWVSTWYDPAKEADAAKALMDQGCDVIAQHTDSPAALQAAEQRGLFAFGQASDMSAFAPKAHLTAIVNRWDRYYVSRIESQLAGTWKSGDTWWGFAQDGLEMSPMGPGVSAEAKAAAAKIEAEIRGGKNPLFGSFKDNKGGARTVANDGDLWKMDWYVEGVQA